MCDINIFNEDCLSTMKRMEKEKIEVDVILTSPPYNNSRPSSSQRSIDKHESRYDIHLDNMTNEEYINWTSELFWHYNTILKENGVILYNMSYGSENTDIMWKTISNIITNTDFTVADCITWKKSNALPNNTSHNKLTRITEFVFVICRKSEFLSFTTNKKIKSIRDNGQKYYENVFNFIEAKNNDGCCGLNKATYSSDLCVKLLEIYAKPKSLVYDSFIGTGTTAVACKKLGHSCIGSELSLAQCEFAEKRLGNIKGSNNG